MTTDLSDSRALGSSIRARRKTAGLTLVQLADAAELSHSFLSQVERGHASPSLESLARIARALGSSQVELLSGTTAAGAGPRIELTRADSPIGLYGRGHARILATGDTRFTPMDYSSSSQEHEDFYTHDEDEFVFVVFGRVRVDFGEHGEHLLASGDSVYFPGGLPHRWASIDGSAYRLIVVKERISPTGTPFREDDEQ
ncbi:XRE family transcriptional regulator [Microbacterium sediminicola]|uniref:XRE family transcriptional regulator n=1 Tax=Microbacterium sediminicola TaxID=415210 RepID=A0ABN2IK93_9MICO